MYFSDYIKILQNHFKVSIGEYEICSILFDFVIMPADLLNGKGEILTISKGSVSKIMNNSASINTQIRDNIYNEKVIASLVDSFENQIVPELTPELEDLCFQMLEQINRDNISPSYKADFEMLARPDTIAPFLAKVFIYVIVNNSASLKPKYVEDVTNNSAEPILTIKGISSDNRVSEYAIINSFVDTAEKSLDSLENEIQNLYQEIGSIQLEENSTGYLLGSHALLTEPYKIGENERKWINQYAKKAQIELPEDFYDFGSLRSNYLPKFSVMGDFNRSLNGTADEKRKAELMGKLYDRLIDRARVISFIIIFQDVKSLALVISNSGKTFDEDVRIDMNFSADNLLTAEEIASFDSEILEFLMDEFDFGKQFEIGKGIDYLSYEESENNKLGRIPIPTDSFPFGLQQESNHLDEIKDLLGYQYFPIDNGYSVQITVDNINQHTSVAFPSVILLRNNHIDSIEYSIKSKRMSNVTYGLIKVLKSSN